MRLNVDNIENGATYTVLLDGKDISRQCYAFDTEKGWVDVYETDSDGNLRLEVTGQKAGWLEKDLVRRRLFGDVSVTKDVNKGEIGKKAHSHWIEAYFQAKRYFRLTKAIK